MNEYALIMRHEDGTKIASPEQMQLWMKQTRYPSLRFRSHYACTFHAARHTIATTVTLTNGAPLKASEKMLSHKSIKSTQHYAKVLDKKVSDDMKALKDKFTLKNGYTIKLLEHSSL